MPPKKKQNQKETQVVVNVQNNTAGGKKKKQRKRRKKRKLIPRVSTYVRPSMAQQMFFGKLAAAGSVKRIASVIAMPSENACQFPTEGGERTDFRTLRMLRTLTNPAESNTLMGFTSGELLVVFYGQPGRALVYWADSNPTTYTANFLDPSGAGTAIGTSAVVVSASSYGTSVLNPSSLAYAPDFSLPFVGFSSTAGTAGIHGAWLPAALYSKTDGGLVFMNAGDQIVFTMTMNWAGSGPMSPVGVANFSVFSFATPGSDLVASTGNDVVFNITGTNNVSSYTAMYPGYYQFRCTSVDMTSIAASQYISLLSVTATLNAGVAPGWANVCMAELISSTVSSSTGDGVPAFGYNARVNGCSVLCTNTTSILNRGGTVRATRFDVQAPFWTRTSTELLSYTNDLYMGDASNGIYTFKENTMYSELYKRHCSVVGPYIDLDDPERYSYIALAPSGSSNQTYAVTLSMVLEFQLTSNTLSTRKACRGGSVEDMRQARILINEVPNWFFENPLHLSQLYGWIKSAGRAVVNNSNRILSGAAVVAPQYAPQIGALTHLLSLLRTG